MTGGNAPLVVKGKSRRVFQGHSVGARVAYRVAESSLAPRLHVSAGMVTAAAAIVSGLAPHADFER